MFTAWKTQTAVLSLCHSLTHSLSHVVSPAGQLQGSWTFYMVPQGFKVSVPRRETIKSHPFSKLASDSMQAHFCCIFFIKAITKTYPGLREGDRDSIS